MPTFNRVSASTYLLRLFLLAALTTGADAQQNGVIAAPTAAAYQQLANASANIIKEIKAAVPRVKTIVFYDPNLFAVIPYYAGTADLVRAAATNLCQAHTGTFAPQALIPSLDIGEAALGLAGLVQLTMPSYATQGQNLSLDNSALLGNFAAVATRIGYTVVNPTYLLPAVSQSNLNCQSISDSDSLADLWQFANNEAAKQRSGDTLAAFQKMRQALTSSEKGAPLLGRVLAAESLAHAFENPAEVAVIDMRLDASDFDSTTRSVLWWRKAKFSAHLAAHYWIFSVHGQGQQFAIQLVAPGYVNILRKNVDLAKFQTDTNR